TPSTRLIAVLGMTEAEAVTDLFQRIAAGSSSVQEAARFNALGVPTTRYYSNGTKREGSGKWHPSPIAGIIANPTYRGTHSLQSRYGAIEREVDALVTADLWERANAQLKQNQRLPKSNATRTYLLRGLITCSQCGSAYVGQVFTSSKGTQGIYYRCAGHSLSPFPHRRQRCGARIVNAQWLEDLVWQDCRTFILHPEEGLAEARRQLYERMSQTAQLEQTRGQYIQALAEKTHERDRIMTMFRRGRLSLTDAETQLDDIANEEGTLRRQLNALNAPKATAEGYEAHT